MRVQRGHERFYRMLNEAATLAQRGQSRAAADAYRALVEASPVTFDARYYSLHGYTSFFQIESMPANDEDLAFLQRMEKSRKECTLHRALAALTRGLIFYDRRDRHEAARMYRHVVAMEAEETTSERSAKIADYDHETMQMTRVSMHDKLKYHVDIARGNLNVLQTDPNTTGLPDFTHQRPYEVSSCSSTRISNRSSIDQHLAQLVTRSMAVGGDACDHCGAKRGDAGVKLNACGKCKRRFYCSKTCQKTAWRACHQLECRGPNEFHSGDIVEIHNLQKRTDLNGQVFVAKEKVAGSEDRWHLVVLGGGPQLAVRQANMKFITTEKFLRAQ